MALLKRFFGGSYEDLWKAFIRPPRDEYEISDLGPAEFRLQHRTFTRTDLDLTNDRGLILKCSHFEPREDYRVASQLPCVIYLHGNSSSRLEALAALPHLLPSNITVFCLDLSGSGKSEGEYISLGWFERDDLACVVSHLRSSGRTGCIGLWGRSMGAVTALLHGDRDPSIAGMVLDSAFSSLHILAEELAKNFAKVPKLLVSTALKLIRKSIKSRAKFDINDLTPIEHVGQCFIPALFAAGKEDNFILPSHTQALHDRYAGDKNLVLVDGDHNSPRPQFFLDSIGIFFYNTMQCALLPDTRPHTEDLQVEDFNPGEYHFARAMEFQAGLEGEGGEMTEEEMIAKAIEESLKEGQVEDPYADLLSAGPTTEADRKRVAEENAKLAQDLGMSGQKPAGSSTSTNLLDL